MYKKYGGCWSDSAEETKELRNRTELKRWIIVENLLKEIRRFPAITRDVGQSETQTVQKLESFRVYWTQVVES